jgi:acid phosphatase type 7
MSTTARLLAALLLPALSATAAPAQAPILAAAGDIACDPADASYNGGNGTATACHMKATSDLLVGAGYDAVMTLGDNQYEDGSLAKYQISYDATWGRVKAITRPVVGNHEYLTAGAAGYYAYFGAAAGDPATGWYSFDLGGWHLIVLNSNCDSVGGCGPGSPQEQWLAADLAAHPGVCTLAAWHHPRFSSGPHGDDATYQTFWTDLHAAGADVVLNGHDHIYERFAPQTPTGGADRARGIREFVVGNGGKNLTGFPVVRANSEARYAAGYGVLALTLYPNGYAWRFVPEAGTSFTDSGLGLCHAAFPTAAADFYTVPPCRLLDTRQTVGPLGGPLLSSGSPRAFPVSGHCGIPADALAVAANVTMVNPTSGGYVQIYPAGGPAPAASTVNAATGRTRGNNAVLALGADGQVTGLAGLSSASGKVHLIVDVSGYFR